ncbi:MAG TPA: ferredoxin [Micromonosporaceae bacterium]
MTSPDQRWLISVDAAACRRSGTCLALAPHAFTVDATGRARPAAERIEPDDAVADAAASCPVGAIDVVSDGSAAPPRVEAGSSASAHDGDTAAPTG